MVYLLIFIAKIIENSISTLRLILVANGKKVIGGILLTTTTMIWLVTAYIIVDPINTDIFKMISFALGSGVGSYLGSIIEEKIAVGNNLISIMTTNKDIINILNSKKIPFHVNNIDKEINLDIIVPRKKRPYIISYIRKYDKKAIIIFQKVLISDSN